MKKGIDISRWQGNIDFNKVKNSGIEFVIIREGYRFATDQMFASNVKKCKEIGLPVMGIYHFSYALTPAQAKGEAALCVNNLKKAGLGTDCVIFFDFEYDTVIKAKESGIILGPKECNAHTEAFCEEVKALGYTPGVYFNIDYYKNWYDHEVLDKYIRWLADWTGGADFPCIFHQYSSTGRVPGIVGNVDMNHYYEMKPQEPEKPTIQKSLDEIAMECYKGLWGNGKERREALAKAGYNFDAVQHRVNILVIAYEVIEGKWGDGDERKQRLTKAGHNYNAVQYQVNILLKK